MRRGDGKTLGARLWARVNKDGPTHATLGTACWLWTGMCGEGGYGVIRRGGRPRVRTGAHRLAWELTHGAIPDGLWVLHRCDTPRCVNPAHLFLGTVVENNADRHAKGRDARGDRSGSRLHPERLPHGDAHWTRRHPERRVRGDDHPLRRCPERAARGERIARAKLTASLVTEIRAAWAAGGVRHRDLAARFGVKRAAITALLAGRTWSHVPWPARSAP